jgi:Spy/CpxP family protein refolding chaperone
MSKKYRRAISIVAAVALLGIGFAACANEVQKSPEERIVGMVDQRVEEALDDIEATDVQRTRVHELKEELIEQFKEKRTEHEGTHAVVEELWLADEADPKKAHALVDERIDEMRATAHRVTDAALELHELLTPEQRRVLAERAKERREHWHHRFHGGEPQ